MQICEAGNFFFIEFELLYNTRDINKNEYNIGIFPLV